MKWIAATALLYAPFLCFSGSIFLATPFITTQKADSAKQQCWNFHIQNTDVIQADAPFHAKYSGPNSLNKNGEAKETVTLNFYTGLRLWKGAEIHADLLMWQGFGLSQTFGIEDFPNGDAYKSGTVVPNLSFTHLFIRQTIGLGSEKEEIADDQLNLQSKRPVSRLTFTIGRLSPLDLCDNNRFAHDQHTQFLNWAMMGNITWDYGQNTLGYTTGVTVELNQPQWSLRYGFLQMPGMKNGFTGDDQVLTFPTRGSYGPFSRCWAMMLELEGRFLIKAHPGAVRLMPWLDEANFTSYTEATALLLANPPVSNPGQGSGITIPAGAQAYRFKPGIAFNAEQELTGNIGVFMRVGWTPGQLDTWTFADPDWSVSLGLSMNGSVWKRPGDTYGLGAVLSGASKSNQKFLAAGGTDMLDGDGNLSYRPETVIETYYDFQIVNWKQRVRKKNNITRTSLNISADYQFIANPAFNRDRGPVSIFAARLHWEFGIYRQPK